MVWLPAAKVPQSLIDEFEADVTESVPTSQSEPLSHVANPIPTNEPPPKVQKYDSVVEEWYDHGSNAHTFRLDLHVAYTTIIRPLYNATQKKINEDFVSAQQVNTYVRNCLHCIYQLHHWHILGCYM